MPPARKPQIRVGISGWTYAPWRGVFYPDKLPHARELAHASRQLNSIEINGTFYGLQRPASFEKWYAATPDDFLFTVKGVRFITHIRRLKDVAAPLANFFASGVLGLKEKLGPILWQLPPTLKFDAAVIEKFLSLLPATTKAAATLAKKHDDRLAGRVLTATDRDRPLRHAVEVRHESFACDAFVKLLRKHSAALVIADTAGLYPQLEDVTADFVYLRLHGEGELYKSGYTLTALDVWATKIRAWAGGKSPGGGGALAAPKLKPSAARGGRDVFVYFDNSMKVKSPRDAAALARRLGLESGDRAS